MKIASPSVVRLAHRRKGGIMDTLVFMLVAILLPAWILGTLYLSFFPTGADAVVDADSQTFAIVDGEEGSSDLSFNDSQSSDDGTSGRGDSVSMLGGTNASNTTAGDFNPNQIKGAGEFTAQQKSALEQKIGMLQSQLEERSQELAQLRETSMQPANAEPKAVVDTAKYDNEIAQLTQQRDQLTSQVKTLEQKVSGDATQADSAMSSKLSQLTSERDQLKMQLISAEDTTAKMAQLDREIKRLNDQSNMQKAKIRTLQDQLVTVAKANPIAATANARDATENNMALGSATPQNEPLEFREWVSSKGSKARLAFVRWEDGKIVVINEAKKKFRLTLDRLSPNDQIYVNSKR